MLITTSLQLHYPSTHHRTLLLFFLLFSSSLLIVDFVQAHIYIYAGCSQEKYEPNSPFEANLNSFITSVVSSSSQALYNTFSIGNGTTSTSPDAAVYGLYQCRGDLSTAGCSRCIESLVNQISIVCPYTFGASLQLEDCFVRYERMDFLGKLDTSLRYRKCSQNVNNDAEFLRRRDDVLADLETAVEFKVSSSGSVEGYGQCLGDLSSGDCSSCLADAVGKLKSLCGSAAAADVYLGQCYARYWASGYYNVPSSSSNEDDVGKAVAIIVGVVAGLAVLIVLLSFCRKAVG